MWGPGGCHHRWMKTWKFSRGVRGDTAWVDECWRSEQNHSVPSPRSRNDIVFLSRGDSEVTEINSLVLTEQLPGPYLCQVKAESKG